jgi:hypothetical protein
MAGNRDQDGCYQIIGARDLRALRQAMEASEREDARERATGREAAW